MKKIIALMAIIGIVFSSCNGKYTIAKRKYNKGFYVSKSGSTSTKPAISHAKAAKITAPEEKIETVVIAKAEEKTIAIAPLKIVAQPAVHHKTPSISNSSQGSAIASTSKSTYANTKEIKPIKVDHANVNSAQERKGDSNLIVMIILALFPILCLIAVYMHDSGITLNFWIDLLLHLTIIGEIIFALLVVLDIIDLA
ncbi:MAG: hypothetical protein SGJ15_05620 [Bacteroidota bacterium]|nr:hypothetical protein [Bacteroidota bacterium]